MAEQRTDQVRAPRWAEEQLRKTDEQLLADCEIDLYRASGPGGQKRNKTSSAVRLRHGPTGLVVTAVESRSQHENRSRAVGRLREAIALHERNAQSPPAEMPAYFAAALSRDASLHVNHRHPDYWLIIQHILDVFEDCGARTADAAQRLRISTGQLIRFAKDDAKLWERLNQMRRLHGQGPLH